jgi:hypothetical protein
MTDTLDLTDAFDALYEAVRRSVRVAVTVRVSDYNPGTATATATPLVREERSVDGVRVPVPTLAIPGVPVIWPRGSVRGMTMGLEDGDECLLVFRHRSHDEIDGGTTGPVDPASQRRWSLSDAALLPGYSRPHADAPTSQWRSDGQPVIYFGGSEALHVGSSTADRALALAERVDAQLDAIRDALNNLTLPVSGATAGPPSPFPFPVPVQSVESDSILVDS